MRRLYKTGLILISSLLLVGCNKEEAEEKTIEVYSYEQAQATYVLENDNLKFTLDPETTYFQVLDKSNNKTWDSNPADSEDDPIANASNMKRLMSTLLMEYRDDTGISNVYNNYQYSIEKKIYTVEQGVDYIKVNYTIGDLKKEYVFPTAIPESRMQIFVDKLEGSEQKKITSYYRKYDINKLRATDDKADLIAKYPDLENECIYVLYDDTQNHLKQKIEELFAKAGYSNEDFEQDQARYSNVSVSKKPGFNITVVYRLEENDLYVELPFEDMDWKEDFPLTKITVLPFFGAGSSEDEGYLLVPEGNGAIINFNNGKSEQRIYYTDFYGWDAAVPRDSLIDEKRSSYPVFGISKDQGAMVCFLENYASVASIEADVSGRIHSYNYVAPTYTTIHSASLSMSAKTDKTVMVYEAKKPSGSITQRYRFIDDSSYSKMAKSYRDYLLERYPQMEKVQDSSTPLMIDFIGAIDKVEQRLGFPVSVPIALTTYQDAYDMLDDFNKEGYQNLSIRYRGWMNGGLKQSLATEIDTITELGSKKELRKFMEYGNELGASIYLEGKTSYTYNEGVFDGFAINRDSAKFPSKEVAKLYDFSPIYYGEAKYLDPYYLLTPARMIEVTKNIADYAKKNKAKVAYSDVGYLLSGDYNPKNIVTRQETIEMQTAALEEITRESSGIMVNAGNDYILPYADYIRDIDLGNDNFHIIDQMVPFYTMAIHGLVNYSGTSINLAGDYQKEILKSVEAGAGLSFTFMKERTFTLQDSNYTNLFGTEYDLWKDEMKVIYQRYETALGHCFNQYITEHAYIAKGVSVTTYEDGTRVYVNYNNQVFANDEITLPANDYKVVRR